MKKYMIMLIFAACATESEPESKKGACLKVQSTANYSNANCTGTILNPTTKPFCVELNDVELCKPTTQCNNGFSYVVTANAAGVRILKRGAGRQLFLRFASANLYANLRRASMPPSRNAVWIVVRGMPDFSASLYSLPASAI